MTKMLGDRMKQNYEGSSHHHVSWKVIYDKDDYS